MHLKKTTSEITDNIIDEVSNNLLLCLSEHFSIEQPDEDDLDTLRKLTDKLKGGSGNGNSKKNKKDGIVVYDIRANGDISVEGKRTRPTKTCTPNPSWPEMKTEKELQKQLVLFEDSVKSGILQDENIKFKDFSERFLTEYADKKFKAHKRSIYKPK